MTRIMAAAFLAAVAITMPAEAHAPKAHGHGEPLHHQDFAAGEPGNPREGAVQIVITMQETYDGKMLFAPDKVSVRPGEQVLFVLTNYGNVDHSFVIGTDGQPKEQRIGSEKAEPNARLVPAASQSQLLWRFSKPGRYEFASVLPGQYAAGMRGTISVGDTPPADE